VVTQPPTGRAIIHFDLDAFYASVEQLRRPELRGMPVIVGGGATPDGRSDLTRGVVSAASYEVRTFGVRSAMPLSRAVRLCPQAIVVPVDFPAYRAASGEVFALARAFTPLVEPLSLDEAFLDVGGSLLRFGSASDIARRLRDGILAQTGLHASFGIATSKVVAKVASDRDKPRGFVVVPAGGEAGFLAPLPLRALPGLGAAAERTLAALGIHTLGQLASMPVDVLERRCGHAPGRALWERAQGIDASPVTVPGRPKSVSREETFAADIADPGALHDHLRVMAAAVTRRLREGGWLARTVTIKLRHPDFTTLTRQHGLAAATDADRPVLAAGQRLVDACWTQGPVRLLGIGVTGLEDSAQLDLLDSGVARDTRIDHALDSLRARFGDHAVHRGTGPELRDLDYRGDDLRRLAGNAGDRPDEHERIADEDSP